MEDRRTFYLYFARWDVLKKWLIIPFSLYSKNKMKTRTAILFVCMGNICRSPTAEGVFRARAQAAGLDFHIDSAGTHAYHIGNPPDPRSTSHAASRGYDLIIGHGIEISLPYADYYLLEGILRVLRPQDVDRAIDLSTV